MEIILSDNLGRKVNNVKLGVLQAKVSVSSANKELWGIIEKEIQGLQDSLQLGDVKKNENIVGARKFYKACGKDPNRYRPSADSLRRRIVKGNGLYKVNNVVDILNLISVRTGISIGGYNSSKINGVAELDLGTAQDEYVGIGRGVLNIEDLPVLRDELGVFGSPTSDSERTMISESCECVEFVFFDFGNDNKLENYLNDTCDLLKEFAGAEGITTHINIL